MPRQLVAVAESDGDHARNPILVTRIGSGNDRQAGAFRDAHQQNPRPGPGLRKQRPVVARDLRGSQNILRPAAGIQVASRVEPDDKVAARRKDVGQMRCDMDPAAVTAREDHWRPVLGTVQVQLLLVARERDDLGRPLGAERKDRGHQQRSNDYPHDYAARRAPPIRIRRYPPAMSAVTSASTGASASPPGYARYRGVHTG